MWYCEHVGTKLSLPLSSDTLHTKMQQNENLFHTVRVLSSWARSLDSFHMAMAFYLCYGCHCCKEICEVYVVLYLKYVFRLTKEWPRFKDELDTMKFICTDFWSSINKKQIDNLRTNHQGVYVLQDNAFRFLTRLSAGRQYLEMAPKVIRVMKCLTFT